MPTLTISRRILNRFFNDGFVPIIIYGELRLGKTAYALKAILQVLQYIHPNRKIDYKMIRNNFGFNPFDVVDTWLQVDEKQPFYVWDDAGFWLFSMEWHDPTLIAIQKYMNVIGTDFGSLIMTTPDPTWILGKIGTLHGLIRCLIVRRDSRGENVLLEEQEAKRFSRMAIAYKPYKSPDFKKHGVNKVWTDEFSCKIPDEIYVEYQPERDHYAHLAKQLMRDSLSKKRKLAELDNFRLDRRLGKELTLATKRKKKKAEQVEANNNIIYEEPDITVKI